MSDPKQEKKEHSIWKDVPGYMGLGLLLGVAGAYTAGTSIGVVSPGWAMWGMTGLGIVLVGVHLFMNLSRSMFRGSAENLALSLIFTVLMAVVYLFMDRNPVRWNLSTDFYELSQQTEKELGRLKEPLDIVLVFQPTDPKQDMVRKLADRMARLNKNIQVLVKDPSDPLIFKQFNLVTISPGGQVLLRMGKKTKVVDASELFTAPSQGSQDPSPQFNAEGALLKALLGLQRQKSTMVCFLAFHGEYSIEGQDGALLVTKAFLNQDLYETKTINVLREGRVPQDCSVVVEAGQTTDISTQERTSLSEFLARGGSLWVNLENDPAKMPVWSGFLAELGVKILPGVVANTVLAGHPLDVFPEALGIDPQKKNLTKGQAAQSLGTSQPPWMKYVYPLEVLDSLPNGQEAAGVLRAPESYFADAEMGLEEPISFSNKDKNGPFVVGAVYLRQVDLKNRIRPQARALVFGDGEWLANTNMANAPSNMDLLLKGMAWLNNDDLKVNAPPKPLGQISFMLTPTQVGIERFMLFFLLPGLMVALGMQTWLRNRRK